MKIFIKCGLQKNSNFWIAFTLLLFLILLIYSNTFQSSWHFDDKPNIVNNYHLHLKDLRLKSLLQAFFSNPRNPWETSNTMYRPVACLTFAFNWYFGKDNVVGYHIMNITIHILTAYFLYLAILNLFRSPNINTKFNGNEHFIALLAATIWAVNPIQTQAVTYIVQRMTSLAAMFYILGIYFYIKARIEGLPSKRILLIISCFLSYLFALGSKENAAMLPVALLLVEFVFFQDMGSQKTRRVFIGIAVGIGMLVLITGLLLFMKGDPLLFLKGYACRPFSFTERLMTEPRIIIYYWNKFTASDC